MFCSSGDGLCSIWPLAALFWMFSMFVMSLFRCGDQTGTENSRCGSTRAVKAHDLAIFGSLLPLVLHG